MVTWFQKWFAEEACLWLLEPTRKGQNMINPRLLFTLRVELTLEAKQTVHSCGTAADVSKNNIEWRAWGLWINAQSCWTVCEQLDIL